MVIFVCSLKMILIILTGQNKVLRQEIQNTLLTRGPMLIAVVPKKVGGFTELCAHSNDRAGNVLNVQYKCVVTYVLENHTVNHYIFTIKLFLKGVVIIVFSKLRDKQS